MALFKYIDKAFFQVFFLFLKKYFFFFWEASKKILKGNNCQIGEYNEKMKASMKYIDNSWSLRGHGFYYQGMKVSLGAFHKELGIITALSCMSFQEPV